MQHPRLAAMAAIMMCFAVTVAAQVATGIRLYTEPDTEAGGGVTGTLAAPSREIRGIFALPVDNPLKVYKGSIRGNGRQFEFTGLPPSRYDLVLVLDNRVFDGLTLHRGADTLSGNDRRLIAAIVNASEPFYNEKTIHRMAGATGDMTGTAQCFATFLRSKKSIGFIDGVWHSEHRRALKLVLLEQVGPGWQIFRTREIFTIMTAPGTGQIATSFRRVLNRIRVTDSIKDLGALDLLVDDETRAE